MAHIARHTSCGTHSTHNAHPGAHVARFRLELMPLSIDAARVTIGVAGGAAVAFAAWRTGALTSRGALLAAVMGASAVIAGADWGTLLLAFFVSSTSLTRWGQAEKERLTGAIVEKGGPRDAAQVIANGLVFTVAALASLTGDDATWRAVGAGAMAAATADTWSTEVGTRFGGTPYHILRGTRVPAGVSGGITLVGCAAAVAGAAFLGGVARAVQFGPAVGPVVLGGVAGTLADSLLGATVQERRRCDTCGTRTERRVHVCGTASRVTGGVPGVRNDAVNLTSTVVGALVTWILTH
jgi:uncharacterized protein (TIGR00297 family)